MLTPIQEEKYRRIYNNMVQKTMDYMIDNHIKTMVLGVSGGIDSSVVAAICNDVYIESNGQIQLYGVYLPSLTNTTVESEAAEAIMRSFCQQYMTVNIDDAVDSMIDFCNSSMLEMSKNAKGNIKARTRMIYLYNIAQLTNGIVMDSDNATENFLGFYTIHGDSNDVCPTSDLWKTEIFELAEYIRDYRLQEKDQIHALGLSMALTPTDGNGVVPGGDMAQIAPGYTYKEVDRICQYLYELEHGGYRTMTKQSKANKEAALIRLCKDSFKHIMNPDTIEKVCCRHFNTEFKRQQLPIRLQVK